MNDFYFQIVTYRPERGRATPREDNQPVGPSVNDFAASGVSVFSYESLPDKYWKKYMYASRFVAMVKAKTPKVTYYSDRAKVFVMENEPDPDYEANFYQGLSFSSICL